MRIDDVRSFSSLVVLAGTPPLSRLLRRQLSPEGDDVGGVDAVNHGGDDVVAEHFTPAAERFVAGDDQRGPLVAGADELEGQVPGPGVRRVPGVAAEEQRCTVVHT